MPTPASMQKALDVLLLMNTAVTNLRLYPPTSAIITNAVDRLLDQLQLYYAEEESLIFSESEKNLLVSGELLKQKDQERPQVASLVALLVGFSIKSITLHQGLDRKELLSFLELMAKRPETIRMEGGFQQAIKERDLRNVRLDEKVYVAKDGDQQLIASLEIKDDQILQYLLAAQEGESLNPERLKEMARDPNWVTRIFQSGMKQIAEQRSMVPVEQLSTSLVIMLNMLSDVVSPTDAAPTSEQISDSIAGMDSEFIVSFLSRNLDNLFEGQLFRNILQRLDESKISDLDERLRYLDQDNLSPSVSRALEKLKGAAEWKSIQGTLETRKKEDEESRKARMHQEVTRLILEGESALQRCSSTETFGEYLMEACEKEDTKRGEELLDRLFAGLASADGEIRRQASEALADAIPRMMEKNWVEPLRVNIPRLVAWLRKEETATKAYVELVRQGADLAERWIRSWDLAAALPVLEFLHAVQTGKQEKNETIENLALEMIDRLSAEDLLDLLLAEVEMNDHKQRRDAAVAVAYLEKALERLMAILRSSNDAEERIRVLNVIRLIGVPAAPVVLKDVKPDGIWFYQRNLARLLGQIGQEAHARELEALLAHEDGRVRKEVIESIYKIGGAERGDILLTALPAQEEALQIQIVTMLGNIRFRPAVAPLVAMLKAKPLTAGARDDLEKAVCGALGSIGDEEALPALKSISRQIDLFSLRPYSAAVKTAAGKAVAEIRRRQGGG